MGVTLFTDRLGKARSVMMGIASTAILYMIVPFLADRLHLALLGLAVLLFAYEFTIVSSIVFLSELVPEKRNTMMASFFAVATAGRAFGAICGPRLWGATEYLLIQGVVAIVTMVVALSVAAPVLLKETVPRS
jgi:predicted MFS family arabinose efflux permease